ncbi:acyl carrier protein [Paraburkholderia humisilvae]|uniref:Carrier domain-containing protein n=1 Tax=Paraburkholderia humisilvae TaxID=627669 RepID=A0A6J5F7B5_9BURK|nr:acyl carrier protein [Paraburkholderia humisilvae]CAB3774253.1 hypothetical protein LMG29542_07669 [Paraburkholderia humisilvae]
MSTELQSTSTNGAGHVTVDKIIAWITEWTESHDLKVPTDLNQTFSDAGFDSLHSVELAFFLEERIGTKIDETVLYDYPTFASLAGYLVSRIEPASTSKTDGGGATLSKQVSDTAMDW